jgi:hypothetical protein
MRHKLVFLKFAVLLTAFLYVLPPVESQAQRNASRKAEKELFGKTRKGKAPDVKIRVKGAAGKAMREQEKKEAMRDKEDEKSLEKLRKRHFEIQSTATQERMLNNGDKTRVSYKAKKQKQRKEQTMPDLQKPEQPKPPKDQAKPDTKDPKKQPKLKQQKGKAKQKLQDPGSQPRLKQHKIKKYRN